MLTFIVYLHLIMKFKMLDLIFHPLKLELQLRIFLYLISINHIFLVNFHFFIYVLEFFIVQDLNYLLILSQFHLIINFLLQDRPFFMYSYLLILSIFKILLLFCLVVRSIFLPQYLIGNTNRLIDTNLLFLYLFYRPIFLLLLMQKYLFVFNSFLIFYHLAKLFYTHILLFIFLYLYLNFQKLLIKVCNYLLTYFHHLEYHHLLPQLLLPIQKFHIFLSNLQFEVSDYLQYLVNFIFLIPKMSFLQYFLQILF